MFAVDAKVIAPVRVASERRAEGKPHGSARTGWTVSCVALLLAMPALAATTADRGECAASADRPEFGFAACSRIIDDASVSVAERVKAFKNRGFGSFNSRNCDRAIADYGAAIKLNPKDAWAMCGPPACGNKQLAARALAWKS